MNHLLKYRIDLNDGTFGRGMANAQNQTRTLDQMVQRVGATIAGAFAVGSLANYGKQAVQTSADTEGLTNAIRFASKSEAEGAKNLQYLNDLTAKHGSNLMAATKGYKTFLGSMEGVPYTMNQIRKMYEQVDVANRVMNLSADDSQGVYLALGQIMSKGKVQAEELRGQIGERIPGAFAIAARAMGVSQAKLNKMMDDGELMAVDFLPRFAAELERTFGSGLEKATSSFQSQSNRRENAILKESASLGTKLQPAYLAFQDIQLGVVQTAGFFVNMLQQNKRAIGAVATGVVAATTVYGIYRASIIAANTANLLLNASLLASPIGVIAATVGIAATAYYALSKRTSQLEKADHSLSNSLHKTRTEFNVSIEALKNGNFTTEERIQLIDDINSKYGEYLPNLIKEKATIEDIAAAQLEANKAFEDKIFMAATEEQLAPLVKRLSELKKVGYDEKIGTEFSKAGAKILSDSLKSPVGSFYINEDNIIDPAAKDEVSQLEKQIAGLQKASQEVRKRLGLSPVKKNKQEADIPAELVSGNKSIRNVQVNIKSLVERLEVVMQGVKDTTSLTDVKRQMTDALIAVVRDAELAL